MNEKFKLMKGNNIELLKNLESNSIDSVITDPPYGLSFMNKKWDYDVPSVEFWKEVFRVLKPGGHILSFGGTRTYHRMVVNIEDAGFEIRDQIQWIYGSGFPKSLNVGKAIDKVNGNERVWVGQSPYKASDEAEKRSAGRSQMTRTTHPDITKGQTEWEGWGTALKPANEPICMARKPLSEKSIAENVLRWRTGGINIDACRVSHNEPIKIMKAQEGGNKVYGQAGRREETTELKENGRFPANVILECICIENYDYNDKGDILTNPECPCRLMDDQSGFLKGDNPNRKPRVGGHRSSYVGTDNNQLKNPITIDKIFDSGGASRFFYNAKVSKSERNLGLDEFEEKAKNNHPTIKPVNLMTYLCRLITPKDGIILDPFVGSGSTGIAALLEGFKFIGMEMEEEYIEIAEARINNFEKYRKFIK